MPELKTRDLTGVEILHAGVTVRGQGSPPGGDVFTPAKLEQIAAATRELTDSGELRPPAKIGHNPDQRMLGDEPAAGWLENVRVKGDKLLADVMRVPAKVADLIDAGAYRTRSVELGPVASQANGTQHEVALKGLAWLGGKMPAVRTLDDVVKLYADHELELEDATDDALVALFESQSAHPDSRADTSIVDDLKITADEQRKLAEALKIDGDVTVDTLLEAATAIAEPPVKESKNDDDDGKSKGEGEKDETPATDPALEQRVANAEATAAAATKELHEMRRDRVVLAAVEAGKIEPAKKKDWERRYDENPDFTTEVLDELKPDEELSRVYGSDEQVGDDEVAPGVSERAYNEYMERNFGITEEAAA